MGSFNSHREHLVVGEVVFSEAQLYETPAQKASVKEESSVETDKANILRIRVRCHLPARIPGLMRWSISCHPIWFFRSPKTAQSKLVNRSPRNLPLEAQGALAQTANIRLPGQEHLPVDFSPIDRLPTQHRSQNRVPRSRRLYLQILHPSHPMETLHLVISKENLKRYHQRLFPHHLLTPPKILKRSHVLALPLGEQRTVRSLIYCTFRMMESLESSRCRHVDFPHSRPYSRHLSSHL